MVIEEQWKVVPEFPDYEVSNMGRVRRIEKHLMRPDTPRGYRRVRLCRHGVQRRFMVHALVARAFIGTIPNGYQHNHKDGNRANNCVDNLEFVTPLENNLHALRELNKRLPAGSKHWNHDLIEEEVIEIRRLRSEGCPLAQLAAQYDVSVPTISMIANRRTWRHI